MMKKNILCVLSFILICIVNLQAQETIPATGINATGSSGSVSYTAGQILSNTITGTNGTVAQGVQQPYEISVVTGIFEANGISLEFVIYPNPAIDFIKLKIEAYPVTNLRYQLYDVNGVLLQDGIVEDKETSISLERLHPNVYFLKISDLNKVVKRFKIIKY